MTNQDIIGSIISVLALDGALNKHEMKFFNDVCERLGVSQEEKNAVLTRIKQGKGSIHLPTDEADQKRLVYFLAQAVVADGKVVPEERKVLDAVVKKMGIPGDYVDRFLESRLQEIKTERYATANRKLIRCPKCDYEQQAGYRCKRCGIIFEKYKEVQEPSDEDKLRDLLASSNVIAEDE